ncbi:MAG: thioredoxin [Haloarculaceae archaeon]
MSETDADDIDDIREQKRKELEAKAQGSDAPDDPIHVEGVDHLNEVVGDYDVMLVDFYADWCGPCKMVAPVVEELAAETDAAVAKVDVDENQQLAAQFQVQGVPTLVLFAGGESVEKLVGVQDKDTLAGLIEQHG